MEKGQIERVAVYIDGGNFYHLALKRARIDELEFSFDEFASFLIGDRALGEHGKRFYTGTVREREGDVKSKEAMAKQRRLFAKLRTGSWDVKTSKLRVRHETIRIDERVADHQALLEKGVSSISFERTREKGIDVKIAVDMMVGAIDDQYDTAILVSSDTDLVPAIDWIKYRTKKKVEYVGFSMPEEIGKRDGVRPVTALIRCTDVQRTLIAADLQKFRIPEQTKLVE